MDSAGGTPQLDQGDLVSNYTTKYHFIRLSQYQLTQWVDVQSSRFINYFTVSTTSTKYILMGKAAVTNGTYQLIIENNYATQGEFTKDILVSEVGLLGTTNHLLGFIVFIVGKDILMQVRFYCSRKSGSASNGGSDSPDFYDAVASWD